ncbi:MAG: hypothetical protein AUJ75_04005 [Candidatus Omnitrophica bacterium CG1_02_49_10]|nr:MAG: hypothetical protein AUJ75_04005 [Candidatus Omnitrophica bacterium CG1_02_49_10]
MRIPVSFKWALRTLSANFRRSLLTSVIIIVGVASIASFLALKNGVHDKMISNSTAFYIGDMQINSYYLSGRVDSGISKPEGLKGDIEKALAGAECAYRKIEPAIIGRASESFPVNLIGIIPADERAVSKLMDTVKYGSASFPAESSGLKAIIGKSLSDKSGLGLGDGLNVILNSGEQYRIVKAEITGIYDAPINQFDRYNVLVDYHELARLIGDGNASEMAIRYKGLERDGGISRLKAVTAGRYPVTGWREILPDVVKLIELNNAAMSIVMCIIYIIVFFGVTNTLIMSFYEKLKVFGIMLGVGITPVKISFLLMSETLILGIFSLFAGTLISLGVVAYFSSHGLDLSRFLSNNPYFMLDMIIYPRIDMRELAVAYGGFMLSFILAGIAPVFKLFKSKAITILREYA